MENEQFEQEIDLKELLMILRRRWWMVLVTTLVVILATISYTYFMVTPQYQASTTMMVGTGGTTTLPGGIGIDLGDLNTNRRLAETYGVIVDSRRVASLVIDEMGLGMTPGSLNARVNVAQVRSTEFIEIQVTDPDPQRAALIANTIGEVFRDTVIEIMQVDNVSTLDEAIVPTRHSSPNERLNIAIGGVLGVMLGVFLVFVVEYFDNTVKSREDVDRQLGLPVLGSIPYMEEKKA